METCFTNSKHKKLKCKYYGEYFSGGVYRIKHHLSGTSSDVKPCRVVPGEVKKEIVTVVVEFQTKLIQKLNFYEIQDPNIVGGSSIFLAKRKSQEEILNTSNMFKKYGKRKCERMVAWKKLGCTIRTDGWTDRRRMTIRNFLVNSPKGTIFLKYIDASDIINIVDNMFKMIDDVVAEVGEDNMVQGVTDNAANYKAAEDLLMQNRKHLYWTPCVAHCIDLMLEDFKKKITLHKETIASAKKITTFIYARTSLISLLHKFTKEGDLILPDITRFATS
ncbi:uncharacterized protein LOC131638031 [Vicia villosa]|uniref:uncharacterized protein LOC131638031 n=1 Tax=Vicia villosa TaxID=3911 RepID=UPI00273C18FF|nr:uncharacterized protein LOC131638031 [Vicia villosa]